MVAPVRLTAAVVTALTLLLARSASAKDPEWVVPSQDPAPLKADDDQPLRQGFTMELGIGIANTYVSADGASSGKSNVGLAPLSLSLGGFASPDVAILFRLAGTSYFERDTQIVNGFYGVHVQYWVNDHVMLSGGPGFTLFGQNALFHGTSKPEGGYGASFRVAVAPLATKHHSLRIAAEVFPSKYEHGVVVGSALNLEWQYY